MIACSRAVQRGRRPSIGQPVGADALDLRAHRDQAAREVADLGLARGVGQHRAAVGERGGHQQVLGGADRDEREHDRGARAAAVGARGVDVAAVQPDRRRPSAQALEVQVDRPCADRAAAGQRDARLARARQQRPEHQDRGAHLAHDVVRRLGAGDGAAERERAPVVAGAARPRCRAAPAAAVMVVMSASRGTLRQHQALGRSAGRRPSAAGRRSWRRR